MAHLGSGDDFLCPENLTGVLKSIVPRKGTMLLSQVLPVELVDAEMVSMDIAKARPVGMTPAVADGAETPIAPKYRGASRVSFEAQDWREKHVFFGSDYACIRRLGTHEDRVVASDVVVVQRAMADLRSRLDNRLEWMRGQALTEGQLQFEIGDNGAISTIQYNHPSFLRPSLTGTDVWSDTANSKPIDDFEDWKELIDDLPVEGTYRVMYTKEIEKLLRKNASLADYYTDIWTNTATTAYSPEKLGRNDVPSRGIGEVMKYFLGGDIEMTIYDGAMNYNTEISVTTATNPTTLVVQDATKFEAGDKIRLTDRASSQFGIGEVDTVDVATRTITLTAAVQGTFPVGTIVHTRRKFIDDKYVLMFGNYREDLEDKEVDQMFTGFQEGVNAMGPSFIGTVAAVRNKYFLEDERRAPGFYSKMLLPEEDPPQQQVIAGIKALPRIDYPEFYICANVLGV